MAFQIPIYQRKVEETGLPGYRQNVRDTASAALGDVGEGIARAAQGVGTVVAKVREEQDTAAVQTAYAELQNEKMDLLDNPETGLVSKRGHDAIAEAPNFVQDFDHRSGEIAKRLTPSQRAKFEQILQRERLGVKSSVNSHLVRESEGLKKQALEGALAAAQSDAAGAARRGEYDKVQVAIMNGLGALDASSRGMDKGAADARRRDFETAAHLGVIDAMLEQGRTVDAREYLTTTRGYMDESVIAKSNIEKRLEGASVRDRSRMLADSAWAATGGDPAKAAELVRDQGIDDTELFDETMQRLQRRGAEEAQARRQADSPRLGRLEQEIRTTGRFSRQTDDWILLSDEGKADALRIEKADQRERRQLGEKLRDMQREIDNDLEARFWAMEPDEMLAADLYRDEFADLSQRRRDVLTAKRRKAGKAIAKENGVPAQAFNAMIDKSLIDAGVGVGTTKGRQMKAILKERYYDALASDDAKAVSEEAVDEIFGKAYRKVMEEGFIYDSETTAIEAEVRGKKYKEATDIADAVEGAIGGPAVVIPDGQQAAPSREPAERRDDGPAPATPQTARPVQRVINGVLHTWDPAARKWNPAKTPARGTAIDAVLAPGSPVPADLGNPSAPQAAPPARRRE
jgi:hypothetical protein